jgi:hypothetical protein
MACSCSEHTACRSRRPLRMCNSKPAPSDTEGPFQIRAGRVVASPLRGFYSGVLQLLTSRGYLSRHFLPFLPERERGLVTLIACEVCLRFRVVRRSVRCRNTDSQGPP